MRRLLIICCAILAGCNARPSTVNNFANAVSTAESAGGHPNAVAASAETIPEISPTRSQLFSLPEGTLRTACAAADYYPDRQVSWRFYGYPEPPEFERYLECLLAEARRDGGRVRLASPSSFPAPGSCVQARITAVGSLAEGRPGTLNGTQVTYDNGQSFYDRALIGAIARSRVGDRVRICVAALPENCPVSTCAASTTGRATCAPAKAG